MRGSTRFYQCRWRGCLRTFADSSNVRRHENVHLSLKSFVCPVADCRKAFTRKAAAQMHIDTAHSGEGGDDMGARIGGDELLVLLHGVRDLQDAMDIAEKLRRVAAEPIPTAAGPITITLSIGVTVARPGERTDALMARADDAMYQAKNSGRNQVVAFAEPVAAGA